MAEESSLDKANNTLDKVDRLDRNVTRVGKTMGKLFKK